MTNPMPLPSPLQGISHLLLDIEGTTCPVSFVAETLFPYASAHLADYLREHSDEPSIRVLVAEVRELMIKDPDPEAQALRKPEGNLGQASASKEGNAEAIDVVPYLQALIGRDRKVTPLKELQGRIWEQGYARGELQGPLFDDVAPALKRWADQGLVLAVYSSGSIQAQQLLYGHSNHGDLRPLFQHWFDTRSGLKQEPSSYRTIAASMAVEPGRILFISDALAELEAAHAAGLRVVFSRRTGNPQQDPGPFPLVHSLEELVLLG